MTVADVGAGRGYFEPQLARAVGKEPSAHRLAPEEVVAELSAAGLRAGSCEVDLPYQYLVFGERAE